MARSVFVVLFLLTLPFSLAAPAAQLSSGTIQSPLLCPCPHADAFFLGSADPSRTTAASAPQPSSTVPFISSDANDVVIDGPIRGSLGASILGPVNPALQDQNPDLLAPPTTDQGTV